MKSIVIKAVSLAGQFRALIVFVGIAFAVTGARCGEPPVIVSFDPLNRELVWSNSLDEGIVLIERSPNLQPSSWEPFFYDVATNSSRMVRLPSSGRQAEFYRISTLTNPPAPDLLLHLTFDNVFSNGYVLDVSGHGNHGLRFGKPCCPTNWPSLVLGPDNSQAAEFQWYLDGWGLGRSGDYGGITKVDQMTNLTQATIMCWGRYYRSYDGNIDNDHNATFISAGYEKNGAWQLGRYYSAQTKFQVTTNILEIDSSSIIFPDGTPDGDTGGWHHYAVTFSNGVISAYFDGLNIDSAYLPVDYLTIGHYSYFEPWIGFGCWTHNGTPPLEDEGDDGFAGNDYPNNGWLNGALDDVRIYSRVLTASEILETYAFFDKDPPSRPSQVTARATASSQVELRWAEVVDNFRLDTYLVRRDGNIVAQSKSVLWYDNELNPNTVYEYSVAAIDVGDNVSEWSDPVLVTTGLPDSGVDIIIDDADGEPWVTPAGEWRYGDYLPDYWRQGFLDDLNAEKGKTITFRPMVPESGDYDVSFLYPGSRDKWWLVANNVPVEIVHGGITNNVIVDQQANYGQWNLLGRFFLEKGTNNVVSVGTEGTSLRVLADAIRLVK